MKVRNLRPGENWPDTLFMGFEGAQLDTQWCWVIEDNGGTVQAGLLACPMHGAIFLLRLAAAVGSPVVAIHHLLKGVIRDAKERGMIGYVTLIDPTTLEGQKMIGLVRRTHGLQWPQPTVLAFGHLDKIGSV